MLNNKIVYIILIFIILLSSGCAETSGNNTTEEQSTTNNQNIEKYQAKIKEMENKIGELTEENKTLTETINSQINKPEANLDYIINNYYYREDEIQTMLGYKKYDGNEPIRALPYSDALQVNNGSPSEVNVVSTVRNKYDEPWALVEFIGGERGRNNYGFVKVEYIKEYKSSDQDYSKINIPISIENIHIGDLLEKAINELGLEYVEMRSRSRGFIHYGEIVGNGHRLGNGIDFFYKLTTHNIWLIRVTGEGYITSEGYGVGSNATDVINNYSSKYTKKVDVNSVQNAGYWSFDVGSNYVIRFEINTEKLTDKSTIKSIIIAPVWWFSS